MPRVRTLALALPLTALLAGCGAASTDDGDATPAAAPADADAVQVVASFYPLEYLVERVGGDHAQVTALTAPGVDPHDVELSPRTVGALGSADLVVFESGMQPAVDDAVAQQAPGTSFDVTPAADLLALEESGEEHDEHADGEDHGDEDAEDDGHGHGHGHGAEDPHFWLDPVRYGDVAEALAAELGAVDPDHAPDYEAGAAALVADLQALDQEFTEGLRECASRQVVTTHDAFGYLGARYDLEVTGITGISPESEPSPARLAEVTRLVQELDVSTVYTEPLLSPDIARTVASETGAQVLTLDPADGLSEPGAGSDYLDIMRTNLQTLREGQGCS
ncbi:metal ABC transporter substrate-binding protein [Ornithinimicrobium pekingense]|uniref:Zinc ABC transporter substrate-binding protein n=1 Tax=Ornithinimicrobium pekingense TaxID=384677 RepID=A0ABQ2F615_9MICO|nr:metal ABC transporter substrate-binding protein [Ornithinimicrobium pekingense]GGK61536.1 zinc ABC transporter substrate-binding protein [Ornithinimicrobium pekingense]